MGPLAKFYDVISLMRTLVFGSSFICPFVFRSSQRNVTFLAVLTA